MNLATETARIITFYQDTIIAFLFFAAAGLAIILVFFILAVNEFMQQNNE